MDELRTWTRGDTATLLRAPAASDDKYSRGVVGLRTGSDGYPGAAVLGVEAAWRTGAGFVRYTGPAAALVIARRPETVIGDTGRADAWVIGSGTDAAERTADETAALRSILSGAARVIVDAGALDLAPDHIAPVLITPHAGELARLRAQLRLPESGSDGRAADAAEVARTIDATVLLKGAVTLVASTDGEVIEVSGAPAWLATAGTGDVLAGILGTLAAADPDRPLAEVAAAGAWLHGYAARLASGALQGSVGHPVVALDVAEALPRAVGDLLA